MPKRSTAGFFDSYAHDFNAIYGTEDTPWNRLVSKLFRRSMRLRFEKTIAGCRPAEGKSALDIGCGPGHYGIALARRKIAEILGIDFAPAMIELARDKAVKAGVENTCRFMTADFMTHDFNRTFDYTILMGFMDYTPEPRKVIERALSLTEGKAFFSFPAAGGFLAWQRQRRYRDRCDLFMYHRQQVEKLFKNLPIDNITIEKISRDYFVTVLMPKKPEIND